MAQVTVTIHGRPHRLECGDGDVDRIGELAAYLQSKIDKLTEAGSSVSYDRLIVMAALVIADELFEARADASDAASLHRAAETDPVEPAQADTRSRTGRGSRPARLTAKDAGPSPIAGE